MEVTASKIKVVEGKGLNNNIAHLSLLLPPLPNLETIREWRKTNSDLENSKENAIFFSLN